jgi:hypothetical protein
MNEEKKFETIGQDVVALLREELDRIQKKTEEATHLRPLLIQRGLFTLDRVRSVLDKKEDAFLHDYDSILTIIQEIYCSEYEDISGLDILSEDKSIDHNDTAAEVLKAKREHDMAELNRLAQEMAKELEPEIYYHLVTNIQNPVIVRYIRFFIDFCLSQALIPLKDKKLITKVLDIVIEEKMTLVSEF